MSFEKLYKELEERLNARDAKILKRGELIRDVNDFQSLLPELNQIITNLEVQYSQTHDKSIKQELNSYLKERVDYWSLIQSFRNEANLLENDITKETRLISDFYKRHEILLFLRNIEKSASNLPKKSITSVLNEEERLVYIPIEKKALYQTKLHDLDVIQISIIKRYQELEKPQSLSSSVTDQTASSIEFTEYLGMKSFVFEPFVVFKTDETKEELLQKKSNILQEMKKIENEKGTTEPIIYSYCGDKIRVDIPKHLVGKYRKLIVDLKILEDQIANVFPPVVFDYDLYKGMADMQKKAYLANLMLQIEVRTKMAINVKYVNGKYVPAKYVALYKEIIKHLNSFSKQNREDGILIDWDYVETLSLEERKNYFKGLVQRYLSMAKEDSQEFCMAIQNILFPQMIYLGLKSV